MDAMKRMPPLLQPDRPGVSDVAFAEAGSNNTLSNVLRLVDSYDDLDDGAPPSRPSSSQDWSNLINRIHQAAKHVREVEVQAHEQKLRIQELLKLAREDVTLANERARVSDARASEMQVRSEALLKAADERVKAAEERARIAEGWLTRVYDTIASEFTIDLQGKPTA
ncbi:hypothetical protein [Methylobacterium sp.]|jgi:predicted AAA+ superfamily ATPase|uniref:hypothetical protein n=1 Tax=Methylobacterium sp. TaxID=409 RepID=UPI0025F47879|nr:hypothetical protein [Methylobacterium sp.]